MVQKTPGGFAAAGWALPSVRPRRGGTADTPDISAEYKVKQYVCMQYACLHVRVHVRTGIIWLSLDTHVRPYSYVNIYRCERAMSMRHAICDTCACWHASLSECREQGSGFGV